MWYLDWCGCLWCWPIAYICELLSFPCKLLCFRLYLQSKLIFLLQNVFLKLSFTEKPTQSLTTVVRLVVIWDYQLSDWLVLSKCSLFHQSIFFHLLHLTSSSNSQEQGQLLCFVKYNVEIVSMLLLLWGLFLGYWVFWCQLTFVSWSIVLLFIARHMRLVCLLLDNWCKVITFWLANEVRLDVLPMNHYGRSRKKMFSSKATCVCLCFNFQRGEIMNVGCLVATWNRQCQLIKEVVGSSFWFWNCR